jgi:hypothetical protein
LFWAEVPEVCGIGASNATSIGDQVELVLEDHISDITQKHKASGMVDMYQHAFFFVFDYIQNIFFCFWLHPKCFFFVFDYIQNVFFSSKFDRDILPDVYFFFSGNWRGDWLR